MPTLRPKLVLRVLLPLLAAPCHLVAAEPGRPYRLDAVDLKQPILWGVECRQPAGGGLAFGGQDQRADDGRGHTRIMENGAWQSIHRQLRAENPLQPFHDRAWALRSEAKNILAVLRHHYFEGAPAAEDRVFLEREVAARQAALTTELADLTSDLAPHSGAGDGHAVCSALEHLRTAAEPLGAAIRAVTPELLRALAGAQIQLELAAECLAAEPPPRSILCDPRPRTDGIAYDAKTRLYVVFGGDHMDYLTNDTWLFDPAARKWTRLFPAGAPAPRANHRLTATGDGRITMTGGYTYASNTDYMGGQHLDLDDGPWTLDLERRAWSGGRLVPADSRTWRSGPLHPDFYQQGPRPDATAFEATLKTLPANVWTVTNPPFRPQLNRDWGTAVIDPGRDLLLRWSGGHCAHGGTDVPHFHFASNRWELPIPVEFPLGQLYVNTEYPGGLNYNLRPWMTGHTYQSYCHDPPSRLMVSTGQPSHFHLYDPDIGDWCGRGDKPAAMSYDSCYYTLTLTPTPAGALCWGKDGKIHRFDHAAATWNELTLTGEPLPGAEVDNSAIAYDSKRGRILMFRKPYGDPPYDGRVWSLDLKSLTVTALAPPGMNAARRCAFIDRCLYLPDADLILMASHLDGPAGHTPTPAFDCAADRWVTLDLKYDVTRHPDRTTRDFPHGRSCGIVFDPKRHLIWGTDTHSQIYVLRLDTSTAGIRPLE